MKTKKIMSILLIGTLVFSSLFITACSNNEDEEDLSQIIERKVDAYRTDLEDSLETLTTNIKVRDYLSDWAKSKGIDYTVDSHDNVIMSVPGDAKAYDATAPTVIVCPYDSNALEDYVSPIVMSLFMAKNATDYGKLTVIFTQEKNRNFKGIQSLSDKYFPSNANVFCLDYGEKNLWSLNTGAGSEYRLTDSVNFVSPSLNKAYEIAINGLDSGIPNSKISSHPNPLKELGNVLANFKTNAIIVEIADINGGNSATTYPTQASMTLVIESDDQDKFTSRMDTNIEEYLDDYQDDYPNLTYTCTEVERPAKVIDTKSAGQFVSLLYTTLNGSYYRDDEDNLISFTSLGSIKRNGNTIVLGAIANSLSPSKLAEIDDAEKTICSLSNIKYSKVNSIPQWTSDADSDFAKEVIDTFKASSGDDLEYVDNVSTSNAGFIHAKNKKCNIVSVSVNENKREKYIAVMVEFMKSQLPE